MPAPPQAIGLTDRDICTDVLFLEKHLARDYVMAESEAAHSSWRHTLHQLHQGTEQLHEQMFMYMQQRGWYETPQADTDLARQIASLWIQKMNAIPRGGWGSAVEHQPAHTQPASSLQVGGYQSVAGPYTGER